MNYTVKVLRVNYEHVVVKVLDADCDISMRIRVFPRLSFPDPVEVGQTFNILSKWVEDGFLQVDITPEE